MDEASEFSWKTYLEDLSDKVTTSSVKQRTAELDKVLNALENHSLEDKELLGLILVLKKTIPLYVDRASRAKVLEVLGKAGGQCPQTNVRAMAKIVGTMVDTAQGRKPGHPDDIRAPVASQLVLLSWTTQALELCMRDIAEYAQLAEWKKLVLDASRLLWGISPGHPNGYNSHKLSISHSAHRDIWRLVRMHTHAVGPMLDALLETQSEMHAVLIGNVVSAGLRSGAQDAIGERQAKIVEFIDRVLLSAKSTPSYSSIYDMQAFLELIDAQQQFSATISKMMVRAPEAVLPTSLWLAQALDRQKTDLSPLFLNVLVEPLSASLLRSTNEGVRQAACELLTYMGNTPRTQEEAERAVRTITGPITQGRFTQVEQRAAVYRVLGGMRAGPANGWAVAAALMPPLLKMTAKETHEAAVDALFSAIGTHFGVLIEHLSSIDSESSEYSVCEAAVREFAAAAQKGLALPDRQATIRHAWTAEAIGNPLWNENSSSKSAWMDKYILPLITSLARISEKAANAPLANTAEAHVGLALALRLQPAGIDTDALAKAVMSAEKSLVLWDKAVHKCVRRADAEWLLRCAEALFAHKCDDPRLGAAILWITCRLPSATRETVRMGLNTLEALSRMDGAQLWRSINAAFATEMAKGAPVHGKWANVLRAALAGAGPDELVAASLLCHHPQAHLSGGTSLWITVVQNAGVDPARLWRTYASELVATVVEALGADNAAGASLAADLVLVGGNDAAYRLSSQAQADVDPEALKTISSEDIAIWRLPADQLFHDPTATQTKSKQARGDDAWVEQMQRERLKRSGAAPKRSPAEQQLVDKQFAKEADIRARVDCAARGLRRGLALVRAVEKGGAAATHMPMLMDTVTSAFWNAPRTAYELSGAAIGDALLILSTQADGLEHTLRAPVAMGLMQMRGMPVSEAWTREGPSELASRVLFRVRTSSERMPLSAAGLSFMLPFLDAVVDSDWVKSQKNVPVPSVEFDEYAAPDATSEQLSMIVGILAQHAHLAADATLPRRAMLQLLIRLMALRPTLLAAARDCLEHVAAAMEGSETPAERAALVAGLTRTDSAVRGACLAALAFMDLSEAPLAEVWVNAGGRGTEEPALEANAVLADELWMDNDLDVEPALILAVIPFLRSDSSELRKCAARAVARALEELAETPDFNDTVDMTLSEMQRAYHRWLIRLEPDYDEFGIVVPGTQHRTDIAFARVAVGDALWHIAPLLPTPEHAHAVVRFLVDDGVLGERAEEVRARMLDAGAYAVERHGAACASELLPLLERELAARDRGTAAQDYAREGVVVLLGRLAQHLPADDKRVGKAVDRLLTALETPAESVQIAVGQCLAPLARRLPAARYEAAVEHTMKLVLTAESYAARRGGAYGLAGLTKGGGLAALKRFSIVDRLRDASIDRSDVRRREGALFAYAALAGSMGRLFEPYAIQFAPSLLALFSDPSADVRAAAQETARAVMSGVSGHGVKLLLPAALRGLEDQQWRTKKGSVEMLGAMAFCAPKQLSLALPTIVPRIIEVLTDTHAQVSDAARRALVHFGDVIHNPEIQQVVPSLLAALDDPAAHTDAALRTLLGTAFVHYVDAPSLALVVPILQRGMRARAASTKRSAAQIMGSMASLTDPADLVPYLQALVPQLRTVLTDPVPEARATAAKALGALVERLHEERFPTLVADLVAVLKSDASGVDRAGAAQGLSEVLSGVGVARLEGLLPEIAANCSSSRSQVREGFMMLLTYLPTTFAGEFQQFLPRVLPSVLQGLADDSEPVRTAALRSGRILVASFARDAVDMLLPELLASMLHASWRIRHSSIELLGELIHRVAGFSDRQAEREREALRASFAVGNDGEADDDGSDDESEDEEDSPSSSNLREALNEKLGVDRCHEILAALYVTRSDVAAMVRQMSFSVWKSVVVNTPRTVRECLPQIMDIVLGGLSSEDHDRRGTAARTLGDLVHKLGEGVMSRIVPILEDALRSDSPTANIARHGVFVGLSEILNSTGKMYIDSYADAMIPLVRRGLCDVDPMVREAAAAAFNSLQQAVGPRAIDAVVPPLLNALTQNDSDELAGIEPEHALEALRELMAVRANVVFPVLIPTLTAVPITPFNARALSSLIQVSGASLGRRLPQILVALFDSVPQYHAAGDIEAETALRDTVRIVAAQGAQDENTLDLLMMQLYESVKTDGVDLANDVKKESRITESCYALAAMCQAFAPGSAARGRSTLGSHIVDWLRILIDLLAAPSSVVVKAAWTALESMCKTIPKDDYDGYVGPVSRAVVHATDSLPAGQKTLPGFNLPKGLGPLLPIYSQGLLTGSPDTKERAVRGMARLVRFTDPTALRLFATGITGPLIRIVGDRHPPNVKAAILSTLGLLLTQVPALMRPFLPQLQRTFVRGLSEADDGVRRRAAAALGALIPLQPRLDPLISELTTGIKQAADQGMRNAMMKSVLAVTGAPNAHALSPASIQAIEGVVKLELFNADPRWQQLRSQVFASLCSVIPEDSALQLMSQLAIPNASDSPAEQATKLQYMAAALSLCPKVFIESEELQKRVSISVDNALAVQSEILQPQVSLVAAKVAKNALLNDQITEPNSEFARILVQALVRTIDPETMAAFDSDTQHTALLGLKSVAKHRYPMIQPHRDAVVTAAMAHVRTRNIPVKLAAERCSLYTLRLARVPQDNFDGSKDEMDAYVSNMGGPTSEKGKLVVDYYRRVLNKLADSTRELDYISDDEDSPNRRSNDADNAANSDEDA
ncbi:translational activator of GCN4 [Coemansia brasiliensis]|uniref:Translational activator of GCN4 n=1 Tax=Coemansia brasiliensis TaxID=2650707 RepID=A0A9W8M1W1_9FUNG|nr:translational activator of GCN4 [Coemansia brasiliensis]